MINRLIIKSHMYEPIPTPLQTNPYRGGVENMLWNLFLPNLTSPSLPAGKGRVTPTFLKSLHQHR